jgi:hypothetical protein
LSTAATIKKKTGKGFFFCSDRTALFGYDSLFFKIKYKRVGGGGYYNIYRTIRSRRPHHRIVVNPKKNLKGKKKEKPNDASLIKTRTIDTGR